MIRVLVVEDSPTARALLVSILASDPEVLVVGEACDGAEGVALTKKLRPDVVTMDIRMPRMDGFEATKEIMIAVPTPIVILTASLLARDIETSMHALRAGALAVMAKPSGPASPGFEETVQHLIADIKSMSQVKVVRHWRHQEDKETRKPGDKAAGKPEVSLSPGLPVPLSMSRGRARVLAIATSTGGPAALHQLFSELPGSFPVPILVVQHITPGFVGGLADWLNKSGNLRVKVAEQGELLAAHTVYVAPDDCHLGVTGAAAVSLSSAPPVGGFRPSGTFLFESVARSFGSSAAALILTGMGNDGVEGLQAVRRAGGTIIAQDEASSVIFGMPGAAVAAGLADLVLPLEEMPSRLLEVVKHGS